MNTLSVNILKLLLENVENSLRGGSLFFRFPTCACYIYGQYIFDINIQMQINF